MSVIKDLEQLSSAEDFFHYLGVAYDPQVLSVSRLHIMRLMGQLMRAEASAEAEDDPSAVRHRLARNLERAYRELETEGPLGKRLFKVHRDAVKPAEPASPAAFVPLSELGVLPVAWSPAPKSLPIVPNGHAE